VQVGRSGDLRSVGGTVGSRPIAAGWLAGCSRWAATVTSQASRNLIGPACSIM